MTLNEYIDLHLMKKAVDRMVKSHTPGLAQIVGIQPMTAPSGAIFSLKPKYSNGWIKMLNSANYDRAMKGVV